MINVFNSPIEAANLDEFHGENDEENQEAVFEQPRKRPKITYNEDGRRVVDGVVTDEEQNPNLLWTATISRGVANEWREKAEQGPYYRMKRYVASLTYDCRVFLYHQSSKHATELLIMTNLSLFIVVLYLFNILSW